MMQLAQLEGLALDAQIMGDAPGQTIAKGVTPMQLSYHLAPVPLCCYNGHNTVYAIMGRDAASQGQIEGWTHWCATCQQLVMTDTEAHAAMHAPGSDSIGFVTGVSFPMEITAP